MWAIEAAVETFPEAFCCRKAANCFSALNWSPHTKRCLAITSRSEPSCRFCHCKAAPIITSAAGASSADSHLAPLRAACTVAAARSVAPAQESSAQRAEAPRQCPKPSYKADRASVRCPAATTAFKTAFCAASCPRRRASRRMVKSLSRFSISVVGGAGGARRMVAYQKARPRPSVVDSSAWITGALSRSASSRTLDHVTSETKLRKTASSASHGSAERRSAKRARSRCLEIASLE
mmetsp:Transcript_28432/g.95747  ORF Transcript_28432/g.95747 Transcript_28432/m.95747 type:complete len:236 (-) Transcript_28432:575-1282(-)